MLTIPPALKYFDSQVINSAAKKIYADVSIIKSKSHVFKKTATIKFYPEMNMYTLEKLNQKLPKNINFGFLKNSFGPPSKPNQIIQSACTFKDNMIIASKDGHLNSGSLYMVDKYKNLMYSITTGISKKSFLRLYKRSSGKWEKISQ